MREIKFRGKRVENGEWVHGDLIHSYLKSSNTLTLLYYIYNSVRNEKHLVSSETIGQFTGILDKNGQYIYDGDILLMDCIDMTMGRYTKKMVVIYEIKDYNDGIQYSWFRLMDVVDNSEYTFFRSSKMTIIGNIHENPDLSKL